MNNELNVEFSTHSNDIIDDGRELYIKGLASTNSPDVNQEIVTPQALQSMLGWIKQAKVNFHSDHIHKMRGLVGSIVQAEIIGNELWITARILPKYRQTIRELLDFGISLGLSVGGKAIRSPQNPHVILDYKLMEITLTPIPASLESKGTVHKVETPTCITNACYLAIKADEQNIQNNNWRQNNMTINNMNTKTYDLSELCDYQTLTEVEQRLQNMAAEIEYNNMYGFDNKAYEMETDELINSLNFPVETWNMIADIHPEDLKMVNDFIQSSTYPEYQALINTDPVLCESAVPRGLDYKMWWSVIGNILKWLPTIYTGIKSGEGIYDTLKGWWNNRNKPREVAYPSQDYYYPQTQSHPPKQAAPSLNVPTPSNPTPSPVAPSYLDRIRKNRFDTKAFEYVGEPMPSNGLADGVGGEEDLVGRIEQMIMQMIREAFVQKTPVIAEMVKEQLQSENQGMNNMMPPQQTAEPVEAPAMEEPPIEEPLTPEEEAAVEEEEFEEEAVRKKGKGKKNKDLKSYVPITYPQSFIDPEPVTVETHESELDTKTAELNRIKSRTSVPSSKASMMEKLTAAYKSETQEPVGCGGLTRNRDEFGRFRQ